MSACVMQDEGFLAHDSWFFDQILLIFDTKEESKEKKMDRKTVESLKSLPQQREKKIVKETQTRVFFFPCSLIKL